MEKKNYMKPSMKVYEIAQKPQILVGSDQDWHLNYIPGQPTDDKHLA